MGVYVYHYMLLKEKIILKKNKQPVPDSCFLCTHNELGEFNFICLNTNWKIEIVLEACAIWDHTSVYITMNTAAWTVFTVSF